MSKQRKFVLISSAVGVIATFLPWWSFSSFGYNASINGFHGMGMLAFLGFVAVGIIAYMDDQTTNLDKTKWMATLIAGAVAFLIVIYYIIETSSVYNGLSIGIYLAALAALGVVLSAFLFKTAGDNIAGGFNSLKGDIENRLKTTNPHSNTNPNTGSSTSGSTNTGTGLDRNTHLDKTNFTGNSNPDRTTGSGNMNTGNMSDRSTNPDTINTDRS